MALPLVCSGYINPMSKQYLVFPHGSAVMNLPATIGDTHLIPESRICPGEGNGTFPLQCFCLGNPMYRGGWWAPWSHKRVIHNLATKQQ